VAKTVEMAATSAELATAGRKSGLRNSSPYHSSEKPSIGKVSTRLLVKENTTSVRIGT